MVNPPTVNNKMPSRLAQLVEKRFPDQCVWCSIPAGGTNLKKEEVTSSILVMGILLFLFPPEGAAKGYLYPPAARRS